VPEKPEKPSQEEVAVDFDPEDAREYLKGVVYPANKEELATAAESNGAPDDLVGTIQTLDRPEFPGPEAEEVVAELKAFPGSG
jgi:hypothetical protein